MGALQPDNWDLAPLTRLIREEHQAYERDAKSAIERAIRVGELLVAAKRHVRHGEWGLWVQTQAPFGERQAQNYMRLAANAKRVADLPSPRSALSFLAESTSIPSLADIAGAPRQSLTAAPPSPRKSPGIGGATSDQFKDPPPEIVVGEVIPDPAPDGTGTDRCPACGQPLAAGELEAAAPQDGLFDDDQERATAELDRPRGKGFV